ncbi:MAG: hypothetical protein V7636_2218 [Actinomycetota bacterium]|jgi:hypothetical protein
MTDVDRVKVLAYRAAAHGLDRRRPVDELVDVVSTLGVQDTPPGNADTSLAARLDLTSPIAAEAVASKDLVLAWSLRGAPHLIAPDDLAVFTLGVQPEAGTRAELWRAPERALVEVEKAMVKALARGPRSKGEVSAAVTKAVHEELAPFCRACNVHHPNENPFRGAPLLGRIVLTSTAPVTLTLAKTWLGRDTKGDVPALRTELLLRYLHCYAPATVGSFAQWAGITGGDAKARWMAVKDALVKVGRGYVLEEDRAALERPDPVAGIRLLPNKDAFLQARDREVLFPDPAHKKVVFPMLGGPGVVLSDAVPVGTWRGAAKGKRYDVKVTPFLKLPKATVAEVEEEAQRVARVRGHEVASVTIA